MKIKEIVNTVICGDCLYAIENILARSIDLVVTSPPYFNSAKKYQRGTGVHYSMDTGEPLYIIEDCSKMLYRILKDDGFYCLNLGFSYGETGVLRPFYIAQRLLKQGWFCIDVIIWHKNNPIPIQGRLTNAFEYIFVFAKHPLTKYPNNIGYKHNVFESPIAKSKGLTSAPFPVELPKFCIKTFCPPNGIVLDPFFGSGTTGVACKNLKRSYIGIEINPEYCQMAKERIKAIKEDPRLF